MLVIYLILLLDDSDDSLRLSFLQLFLLEIKEEVKTFKNLLTVYMILREEKRGWEHYTILDLWLES